MMASKKSFFVYF